jgi:hypothetical protein
LVQVTRYPPESSVTVTRGGDGGGTVFWTENAIVSVTSNASAPRMVEITENRAV